MAHLTKKINGNRGINWYVARHVDVAKGVDAVAGPIYARAKAKHAVHRRTGASYVGIDWNATDAIIFLDDERGLDQAFAIEFGHIDPKSGEWVEGIHALMPWFSRGG